MADTLSGYVDKVLFSNDTNGYCVFLFALEDGDTKLTCVGTLPSLSQGEYLELHGSLTIHPAYGEQFCVESYDIKTASDAVAMERYLASGVIKGVGAGLAARIVKKFKDDTFRVIEEEPQRLVKVKGVSERIATQIHAQFVQKSESRSLLVFLAGYDISAKMSTKIIDFYGAGARQIIENNPYKLAEDIEGIGFKIADGIARKVGIPTDSEFRFSAGILYALSDALSKGHVYLPLDVLKSNADELLEVACDDEEYTRLLSNLVVDGHIRITNAPDKTSRVYRSIYYRLEKSTAAMLLRLDEQVKERLPELADSQAMQAVEQGLSIVFDDCQRDAIKQAVGNGVFVLTGGPGTGKTTVLNGIINVFEQNGYTVMLAAPTGRAAKRMTQATGHDAKTVHRMLEPSGPNTDGAVTHRFAKNEDNPIEADAIIIDEVSMMDISLMHALLKAVIPGARLVLVGDENQLPSVGPGNVLKDIIASDRFATVRLNKIFRQADTSSIIINAHKINSGIHPNLTEPHMDFFYIERLDAQSAVKAVMSLVRDKLPARFNMAASDIQVLTPMRNYDLGVENLNKQLQNTLNAPSQDKQEITFTDTVFREGDKVMQTKNNYNIPWEIRGKNGIITDSGTGVFNGDTGEIINVNTYAEKLTVRFDDDRVVEYPFPQLDELDLAYAVTVHKSQGSEYPVVVLPLLGVPRPLRCRNILYTAVTRAKKSVVIVGDYKVFNACIDNMTEQNRYTGLRDFLCKAQ